MRQVKEQGYTFEEWITPEQIDRDVQAVADRINSDYAGKNLLIIVVLNGAFIFAADLMKKLNVHCEVAFIRVSSSHGMASTGELKFIVP